jgi:hypothetical protein
MKDGEVKRRHNYREGGTRGNRDKGERNGKIGREGKRNGKIGREGKKNGK